VASFLIIDGFIVLQSLKLVGLKKKRK